MKKSNETIKREIRYAGVRQWEVAEKIGIGEDRFSKMLRRELTKEQAARVYAAIEEIKKEREDEENA